MMLRYWDANAFLGVLKREPDKNDICSAILRDAERGGSKILTSAITFVEVVHMGRRQELTQAAEATIAGFFERSFIEVVAVEREIASLAREMLWRVPKLSHRDAVHFATAFQHKATILETYDPDLLDLNGEVVQGRPMRIEEPYIAQTALAFPNMLS